MHDTGASQGHRTFLMCEIDFTYPEEMKSLLYSCLAGSRIKPRVQENARLVKRIGEIHMDSRGAIRVLRMHEDLLDEGETLPLNRLTRLMAAERIQGCP